MGDEAKVEQQQNANLVYQQKREEHDDGTEEYGEADEVYGVWVGVYCRRELKLQLPTQKRGRVYERKSQAA